MKKWFNKLIYKLHCLLFGHKWCNNGLPDKDGWMKQWCECGAKGKYNVITKERVVYGRKKGRGVLCQKKEL